MKSGNLNFLEPSGPLQACNGTDIPFLPCGCCMYCVLQSSLKITRLWDVVRNLQTFRTNVLTRPVTTTLHSTSFRHVRPGKVPTTLQSASYYHATLDQLQPRYTLPVFATLDPAKFLPHYTRPVTTTLHSTSYNHATLDELLPLYYTLPVFATLEPAKFLPHYTRPVTTTLLHSASFRHVRTGKVPTTLHPASYYHSTTLCQFSPR